MDKAMINTTNFNINTLLGLSDEMKLDIIHLLSKSMLQKKTKANPHQSVSQEFSEEAIQPRHKALLGILSEEWQTNDLRDEYLKDKY